MASERIQRQISRLLDEAEQASELEEWETVRNRASRVLAFDPENTDAEVFLAAAQRSLASLETAVGSDANVSLAPAPSTTHPTSFANSRYHATQLLGEGGKKKVYLAHDTTLDREVAFALIKTEGLNETSRIRVQREAQAMGRLGSHPLRHINAPYRPKTSPNPWFIAELRTPRP